MTRPWTSTLEKTKRRKGILTSFRKTWKRMNRWRAIGQKSIYPKKKGKNGLNRGSEPSFSDYWEGTSP